MPAIIISKHRFYSITQFFKGFIKKRHKSLVGIFSVTIFLALWELIGSGNLINPIFISSPSRIIEAGIKVFATGEMWYHMYVSLSEFLLGYGLAVAIGIPFGILYGWYPTLEAAADPFVNALYATPRIALMSLLIIWFGIGIWSKVAIIFLGALFPIIVNTQKGIKTIDASLLRVARAYGARDWDIFRTVGFPSSVPYIITGLRLAIGRALVGVVVGEYFAATAGVGFFINQSGATFQTDKMFVGVAILAFASVLLTEILRRLEKRFDVWRK